ncbi:hypothetical protein AK812_SmicGene11465 [Symbiodinium microadriaticum]|uniref:Uncharacterized protein n=1 Tax=Symbiodinium microadriaticum TaxID=2951 RepID=A0A1Q9EDA6_SYMMI|nr:hypothetical protein AK812_SmicGene11465 [Symbiodinium microadriaticum]
MRGSAGYFVVSRVMDVLAAVMSVISRTITAMLRFLRNILLWGDPDTSRGDNAPELVQLQKQAQAVATTRSMTKLLVPIRAHDLNDDDHVHDEDDDGVDDDDEEAEEEEEEDNCVVPTVAEVIYSTNTMIVLAMYDPAKVLQQLKMEKGQELREARVLRVWYARGDSRRFTKTIIGVAECFAAALKRTPLAG